VRPSCIMLCLSLAAAAAFAAPQAAAPGSSAASEMSAYLTKAQDAIDSNHLAEAIRSYVAVLALAEENPSAEAAAKAKTAEAELGKIAARLSLEPAGSWIDPKGNQIEGDSRSLGKDGGLAPAVYLFENFGTGKSPVGDAPIYFEFAKNSGSLIAFVTTDAYGKANTTVAKLDEPGKEAVIRAYPVFKARGKAYAFQGAFRDFAYLPPARVIKVLALESSEYGASDTPGTVDAVASVLKDAGLEVLPFNAKLASSDFQRAYAGDAKSLAALGISASSPYAAFVLVEVAGAKQMELGGKKYNIFTAAVNVSMRIVRRGGSIVYSMNLDGIKGQGASKEAAVADAYRRARGGIGPALQRRMDELEAALTKE
jgi:hypothetical protein